MRLPALPAVRVRLALPSLDGGLPLFELSRPFQPPTLKLALANRLYSGHAGWPSTIRFRDDFLAPRRGRRGRTDAPVAGRGAMRARELARPVGRTLRFGGVPRSADARRLPRPGASGAPRFWSRTSRMSSSSARSKNLGRLRWSRWAAMMACHHPRGWSRAPGGQTR